MNKTTPLTTPWQTVRVLHAFWASDGDLALRRCRPQARGTPHLGYLRVSGSMEQVKGPRSPYSPRSSPDPCASFATGQMTVTSLAWIARNLTHLTQPGTTHIGCRAQRPGPGGHAPACLGNTGPSCLTSGGTPPCTHHSHPHHLWNRWAPQGFPGHGRNRGGERPGTLCQSRVTDSSAQVSVAEGRTGRLSNTPPWVAEGGTGRDIWACDCWCEGSSSFQACGPAALASLGQ